jgi:hypothetical protein
MLTQVMTDVRCLYATGIYYKVNNGPQGIQNRVGESSRAHTETVSTMQR